MLLKSCAIPPARAPNDSIFCACTRAVLSLSVGSEVSATISFRRTRTKLHRSSALKIGKNVSIEERIPVGKSHSCSCVIDLRNAQALEICECSFQYKSQGNFQSFKASSLVFRPITWSIDGLKPQPSATRTKARFARAKL